MRRVYVLLVVCWLVSLGCSREDSKLSEVVSAESVPAAKENGRLFTDIASETTDEQAEPANNEQLAEITREALAESLSFQDASSELGLKFEYRTGQQSNLWMPESMGGGVGVLDHDLDGLPDLVFSRGGNRRPGDLSAEACFALFRNRNAKAFELTPAAFGDVQSDYGQGLAVGDFNSDGFEDVYLTTTDRNLCFQNCGDGTFVDVTDQVLVSAEDRWSTSAQFADLNGDGLLDLYVCNYLMYDMIAGPICRDTNGEGRLCRPQEFASWENQAFINQGDGTYLDEANSLGLTAADGKSLGVAIADFDRDDRLDVYVANDTTANFLFRGNEQGMFSEEAVIRGCATNQRGEFEAGMGVAVSDVDRDGWLDIFCTNYFNESNTLYRNLGKSGFQDATSSLGLALPSQSVLGFGATFCDFNHDGHDELFVTNGHVDNHPKNKLQKMPPQLFALSGEQFEDISPSLGPFFSEPKIGRGVAKIDFDTDGDIDFVVVHQNGPAALLMNQRQQTKSNWLQVKFVGRSSPRHGQGVKVQAVQDGRRQFQEITGGGTYLSTDQKMAHFGFASDEVISLEVRWPSGRAQRFDDVRANQVLELIESDDTGSSSRAIVR
ncbi:CRTAC1 family protein [Rhodopirellula bahusiensis]|uniref:ASPIC/UnbV domain-containing protein n=1 Tax=Rhodopirellula bahusiensis TaxID=2014065 RepID=A0A2G1W8L5_9BACT|nr:CRTAC1 family protein [Rhodopirellula bahusiensis]PHQ35385.1 hypothetical protein CEE69_10250 [Rhodopirellula bahusiensis]